MYKKLILSLFIFLRKLQVRWNFVHMLLNKLVLAVYMTCTTAVLYA